MKMTVEFNTTTAMLKQYCVVAIAPMSKSTLIQGILYKKGIFSDPEVAYIYSQANEECLDGEHLIKYTKSTG